MVFDVNLLIEWNIVSPKQKLSYDASAAQLRYHTESVYISLQTVGDVWEGIALLASANTLKFDCRKLLYSDVVETNEIARWEVPKYPVLTLSIRNGESD